MPRRNNKIRDNILGLCLSILIMIIMLSGCIQRQEIKQGRIIKVEDARELELGMSPAQVEYILGSPSMINPLDQERWEYVYILRNNRGKVKVQKGYLIFSENKLSRIELDEYFQ